MYGERKIPEQGEKRGKGKKEKEVCVSREKERGRHRQGLKRGQNKVSGIPEFASKEKRTTRFWACSIGGEMPGKIGGKKSKT